MQSRWVALVFVASALAGCATNYPLMPTPALYTGAQAKPLFADLPPDLRSPAIDLLYITDRAPAAKADDSVPYTAERSRSMAFGSAVVEFEGGVNWDVIVRQSTMAQRTTPLDLKLGPTRELGRYPRLPYRVVNTPAGITRAPTDLAVHAAADKALRAELARRLEQSPRKELVLYVHGFANTFQDAAFTMASSVTSSAASSSAESSAGRRARVACSSVTTSIANRASSRSRICARRCERSPARPVSSASISSRTAAAPTWSRARHRS